MNYVWNCISFILNNCLEVQFLYAVCIKIITIAQWIRKVLIDNPSRFYENLLGKESYSLFVRRPLIFSWNSDETMSSPNVFASSSVTL